MIEPRDVKDAISRAERYLPDTDRDRYDRAYQRGREGMAMLVVLGLAIGAVVGGALMWILDPEMGNRRRERIADRADELSRRARGEGGPDEITTTAVPTSADAASESSTPARGVPAS